MSIILGEVLWLGSVCVESVVSFFFLSRTSATSRGVVSPDPSLEFILNMAHASFVDVTNVNVEIRMIVVSIFPRVSNYSFVGPVSLLKYLYNPYYL